MYQFLCQDQLVDKFTQACQLIDYACNFLVSDWQGYFIKKPVRNLS